MPGHCLSFDEKNGLKVEEYYNPTFEVDENLKLEDAVKQIEDIFWEKGYRNNNGKRICHSTMSNTISNPKYNIYMHFRIQKSVLSNILGRFDGIFIGYLM